MHTEADAEIGHVPLAGKAGRIDLAFRAPLAEPARHENAMDVLEEWRGVFTLEHIGLDPVELDLHPIGNAAMGQGFDERFISVLHAGIFADNRDGDLAFRIGDALGNPVPTRQIWLWCRFDPEGRKNLLIKP